MNTETGIWRFLDTGKGNAIFNMAMDEAILSSVRSGYSSPVFRLFEWNADAITFGYSQCIADILDTVKCAAKGIEIARRLTGGRAVYHTGDIAYSVTGFTCDERFGGTIKDTFRAISMVIADGLHQAGIDTDIREDNQNSSALSHPMHEPCFLTASSFEIMLEGKKIAGSAQRRFGKVFMLQGTILTGPGSERIADYMKDGALAAKYRTLLASRTIDLNNHTSGRFSTETLKQTLFDSFERAVGMPCDRGEPTADELKHAERQAVGFAGPGG